MSDQAALHRTLLELGGRLPDAALATARLTLAESGTASVPEPGSLLEIGFSFVPAMPDARTFGRHVPPLLDLVGRELGDDADQAAVRAVAELPDAVALWRAWRLAPEWAAATIPPSRVYVLEANGPQAGTAATMMRELAAAGVQWPQVEVYRSGEDLPPYARQARNNGALLWVEQTPPPPRVARVFDVVDDAGARFLPEHERLTGDDLAHVARYLDAGAPVLATTARLRDEVEPERGEVVPMSYRTDGPWVWPESVHYYLVTYGFAPEPELLARARAAGVLLPAPDPAEEHRALALLFQSAAFAPVPS
ncbi:hypothetical protein [Actinoplanes sp. RD1]|uniref:hypothetical protein n=1 Tax=Actinoplanes sp. RD1 TaxID=3064538 RepID=UPI00274226B9|nr:hypothetical protein [Actinoplanes sp. RD1]